MKVAAVQLEVRDGQTLADRLAAATRAVRDEAERGAELVLLPEMWAPGYFAFDAYEAVAEPLDGPLATALAVCAASAGVVLLAGSIVERSQAGLHNTSLLFGRDGTLLATYRKVHLFGYGSREQELLTPGDHPVVVPLGGARVGLTTCYDLRFPELYRRMVDDGAELFLVVAGWPFPRLDAWRTLGRARAIENQAALVACNAAGRQAASTYAGNSYACGPYGSVLGELDDRPGVLRVDVDPAEVAACRREFPALRDRVL